MCHPCVIVKNAARIYLDYKGSDTLETNVEVVNSCWCDGEQKCLNKTKNTWDELELKKR